MGNTKALFYVAAIFAFVVSLCVFTFVYRYGTYPHPTKLMKSVFNAKHNCNDFNDFVDKIRLGEWKAAKSLIAPENKMILIKGEKVFYMSEDRTEYFLKTTAHYWATLDECFSKHKFNGKENKVHISGSGYAVFDDERALRHLKWP